MAKGFLVVSIEAMAYLSDQQTSQKNPFRAGAMPLKLKLFLAGILPLLFFYYVIFKNHIC